MQGRKAGVVIASTRAAAGIYDDETGPVIIDWLTEHGFEAYPAMVVPDGEPVGAAIRALLTQHPAVVITSGGTGLSPEDRNPDVTLPLLDREIPAIMEGIRRPGAKTPLAALSRGHAGVQQGLPSSTCPVRERRHGRTVRPGPRHRAPLRPTGGWPWALNQFLK